MRVTILFASLLVLAACKRTEPGTANANAAPAAPMGYIHEHEGNRAIFLVQGDMTLVVPFNELRGALLVRGKTVAPVESPVELKGFALCPCCVRGCGSECMPGLGLPCEPLPAIAEWPGGFGHTVQPGDPDRDPAVRP